MKRLKRNVSFSSDIADFSSSSTCLQDYHDDDGHDSDNDVGCGVVVGTKITGLSSDESENNGEEYNFLLRQQKRRYQSKQQKTQWHHRHHQQQMVDTTVAMSKIRRGMKRRNEEEGNSSTWSASINTQVQRSRTNNKCMIKMYVGPSTTNSSTQQLKTRAQGVS